MDFVTLSVPLSIVESENGSLDSAVCGNRQLMKRAGIASTEILSISLDTTASSVSLAEKAAAASARLGVRSLVQS